MSYMYVNSMVVCSSAHGKLTIQQRIHHVFIGMLFYFDSSLNTRQ